MKSKLTDRIRRMFRWSAASAYFRDAAEDIMRANLLTLKKVSVVLAAFILFFMLFTPLMYPAWHPTYPYFLFSFIALLLIAVSFGYDRFAVKKRPESVTALCILFYISAVGGCMAVDILPETNVAAVYFPIVMVVLPALFILPDYIEYPLIALLETVFLLLANQAKDVRIAKVYSYSSVVSMLSAYMVARIVMQLRASEGITKYRYKRQGTVDQLTRVLNRAECETQMRDFFCMRKQQDPPCALLMFDIDGFKSVNDTFGHLEGDRILGEVGRILGEGFRKEDIIGRIGGDEFMILIREVGRDTDFNLLSQRVRTEIESLSDPAAGLAVSYSQGIAELHGTAAYEEMYQAADQAMYEAKRSGRGQCVVQQMNLR